MSRLRTFDERGDLFDNEMGSENEMVGKVANFNFYNLNVLENCFCSEIKQRNSKKLKGF